MVEEIWHEAVVRSRERLSPHLVRVRLGWPELSPLVSTGVPDERLVLELPDGSTRTVTARTWDPAARTLDLDVVRHPGGVLAAWAERAEPGDPVRVSDLRGWYAPPSDAGWQLLVADLSGLPALARIAEATAADLVTSAVVELPDPGDRQPLPGAVDARWLVGGDETTSRLPEAVRGLTWPEGPGYVWFAGEAAAARAVRQHLRGLGWPVARYRVLGYWRAGQQQWQRRYEQVAPGLERVYTEARARGLTSDEALEAYDDALEQRGL